MAGMRMTFRSVCLYSLRTEEKKMTEERKRISFLHLAVGAGIIAVAAVGVAAFVPRRRWAMAGDVMRGALEWPLVGAITLWAASLWNDTPPRAPQFDDLRPYDEF
jgi:hypothetical protein